MSGPSDGKPDAREFRRRLDEVLRQRQPEAMRDYLIAEDQWQTGNVPADLERAMWLMIAASSGLADLHGEAERWLVAHGYEPEARAVLGRGAAGRTRERSRGQRSGSRGKQRQGTPGHGAPPHSRQDAPKSTASRVGHDGQRPRPEERQPRDRRGADNS